MKSCSQFFDVANDLSIRRIIEFAEVMVLCVPDLIPADGH